MLEQLGFTKAKDMIAYHYDLGNSRTFAARAKARHGIGRLSHSSHETCRT